MAVGGPSSLSSGIASNCVTQLDLCSFEIDAFEVKTLTIESLNIRHLHYNQKSLLSGTYTVCMFVCVCVCNLFTQMRAYHDTVPHFALFRYQYIWLITPPSGCLKLPQAF